MSTLIVTMSSAEQMYDDSVLAGDEGLLSQLENLEIDISFDSAGQETIILDITVTSLTRPVNRRSPLNIKMK